MRSYNQDQQVSDKNGPSHNQDQQVSDKNKFSHNQGQQVSDKNRLSYNQEQFQNSVLNREVDSLSWVVSDCAEERLAIYRHTVINNLINALSITYPGIWKLLGNECANQVARRYLQHPENFPKSGCLDDWGGEFGNYLKAVPELEKYDYLPDYAKYEWLKQLSASAPDQPCLSLSEITEMVDHIEDPHFVFHPSVSFIQSNVVLSQLEVLITDPLSDAIQLERQNTFGIIFCTHFEVKSEWTNEPMWDFIRKLHAQNALSQVCEYHTQLYKNSNSGAQEEIAKYLSIIFSLDLIINIY